MKNRILAALVCAAMALSLAGCAAKEEERSYMSSKKSDKDDSSYSENAGNSGGNNSGAGSDNSSDNSSAEDSKPEPPAKYPEATNVLYLQGEKLDFPETPATDFDYEIKDGQVYIKEYFGRNPDVHIPETIEGKKVAGLQGTNNYFNDHFTIKRLIVPDNVSLSGFGNLDSVTFLGEVNVSRNFSYTTVSNVYFGGDIPSIAQLSYFSGSRWFRTMVEHDGLCVLKDTLVFGAHCSGDVVVPEGVTKIMDYAFNAHESGIGRVTGIYETAKLNSVTLPDGLKEIGKGAFYDTGLTSVNIPDGVTSIGDEAFAKTKLDLDTIKIPDSVSRIGSNAFGDSRSSIGTWLLNARGAYGHFVVSDDIKHIADSAFAGAQMQSLTLPDGLVSIGDKVFAKASFKDITLPDSITDIGALAFADSPLFSLDKYKGSNGVVVFGQVAVIDNSNSGNYVVPDGVKRFSFTYSYSINDWGYRNVTITLPDSVDKYVFNTDVRRYFDTVIYKGTTYKISENVSQDWIAERAAFYAAIAG